MGYGYAEHEAAELDQGILPEEDFSDPAFGSTNDDELWVGDEDIAMQLNERLYGDFRRDRRKDYRRRVR